jgi:hypothetical protein
MERLTRQQAKAAGKPRCFGGVCGRHPALEGERYVSGACVGCASDNIKAARLANPELAKAHRQKQNERVKNTPELLEKKRRSNANYRAENKEKIAASINAWRSENKPLLKEYVKRFKAKNPDVVRANTAKRRAARLQRTPSWLTEDDFWMISQAYELAELRTKIFGFTWHVDHVIPLQGRVVSGLHTPYNLQVVPWLENIQKGNKFSTAQNLDTGN